MEPIDFEDSIREWRKNKIYLGKGYFHYKCSVEHCKETTYSYTTSHKNFKLFATEFDLQNKNHIHKYKYCEEHLFIDDT